jgi:hypothetical protein
MPTCYEQKRLTRIELVFQAWEAGVLPLHHSRDILGLTIPAVHFTGLCFQNPVRHNQAGLKMRIPSYRLHKPSGKAVVTIAGKDHYLGLHDSEEGRLAYDALVAPLKAAGNNATVANMTISHLAIQYMKHAESYYRKNGKVTGEVEGLRTALKALIKIARDVPVPNLSPRHIDAMRETLLNKGNSRSYINKQTNRIRRVIRWGIAQELVPHFVLTKLEAIDPLKAGRTKAKEAIRKAAATDVHPRQTIVE